MPKGNPNTKGRRRVRGGDRSIPGPEQPPQPGSASESEPAGIPRFSLLKNTLAERSGYLFYDGSTVEKMAIAKIWLKMLKKHPKYQPLKIDPNSTINDLLSLLHTTTTKFFKGWRWTLHIPEENKPRIYFFKSLGTLGGWNLPMEWIHDYPNPYFKEAATAMILRIAKAFHIKLFDNQTTEWILEPAAVAEDGYDHDVIPYLLAHLKEQHYSEEKDMNNIYKMAANMSSYVDGEIFDKMQEFKDAPMLTENQFEFAAHQVKTLEDPALYNWLMKGKALADTGGISIHQFDLNLENIDGEDSDPVSMEDAIFFPWSTSDCVNYARNSWLDDIAQGVGVNEAYEFGWLDGAGLVEPSNPTLFKKLIAFIEEGQDLEHKRKLKYSYADIRLSK